MPRRGRVLWSGTSGRPSRMPTKRNEPAHCGRKSFLFSSLFRFCNICCAHPGFCITSEVHFGFHNDTQPPISNNCWHWHPSAGSLKSCSSRRSAGTLELRLTPAGATANPLSQSTSTCHESCVATWPINSRSVIWTGSFAAP